MNGDDEVSHRSAPRTPGGPSGARPSRRAVLGMLGAVPVAGVLTAAAGSAAAAPRSRSGGVPAGLRPGGELDRLIADLAARDEFSGTVMVAHRGRPVLTRSHGMADARRSIPNRAGTIFNLASASKPFTGLAIMQLVERGEVGLHEPLGTYLDGFPKEVADNVTVHHLLTHTGGVGDFQLDPEYQANAESNWTSEAAMMDGIMAAIRRAPLTHTPGTRYAYSSSGIAVLGGIVAAVSKEKSYYEYVRRHIFQKAGMAGTGFFPKPQWRSDKRFAHPYWFDDQGRAVDGLEHTPPDTPTGHKGMAPYLGNPGGGAFSTAGDLVRMDQRLRDGTLLSPAYLELFLGLKHPNPPAGGSTGPEGMAYGLPASLINGQWTAGHGGGMYVGASTSWRMYRDSDWMAVVLCNHFGKSGMEAISTKASELITGKTA